MRSGYLGEFDLEDARVVFKLVQGEPVFIRLCLESQTLSRESGE